MDSTSNISNAHGALSLVNEPSFGLALGGGGARGISHIHVIEALDELGIKPKIISGSSIGAIMGAAMASGMSGQDLREYCLELLSRKGGVVASKIWTLGTSSMSHPLGGFRLGQFNLEKILPSLLPSNLPENIENLRIPLKVLATDYYGQNEAVLVQGNLVSALAASAAIPAVFMPVRVNGRIMVDGGIYNPVPYEHLMDQCDIVIGVDVVGGPDGDDLSMPSRLESMVGTSQLMMKAAVDLKLKMIAPHIYLLPPVNGIKVLDFLKITEILESTKGIKDDLKRAIHVQVEAFHARKIAL